MSEQTAAPMYRPLTDAQLDTLRAAYDLSGDGVHAGMHSTERHPIRRLRSLVSRGLLESCGFLVVTDGDGFTREPERERECFAPTAAGRAIVEASWGVPA